jgi:hypothetical protein
MAMQTITVQHGWGTNASTISNGKGNKFSFRQRSNGLNLTGTFVFVLIILWVIGKLQRDLSAGMRAVFALLVFLPSTLRIDLPAPLPQLTIHRILIVIAFVFLIRNRSPDRQRWSIPNLWLIVLFGLSQVTSLLFGTDFVGGLKNCGNYAIETVLFYLLISEYVLAERDLVRLLSSVCYGLAAVAVVATFEKYFRFDPVGLISSAGGGSPLAATGDIAATYPHRILMGYAMAMGVLLSLALASYEKEVKPRRIMYGITLLLIGATYFSTSRGPWLGLGLGLFGIAVLGGRNVRKKLALIAVLAAAILVLRPGVRETISNLYNATFDSDSLKGGSYDYRWQLWTVAWNQIRLSPVRFLFGYGPSSTMHMDLSKYWYGEEGWTSSMTKLGYTSWDNNYAADLIELGVVGLLLEAILFLALAKTLVEDWLKNHSKNRTLQGGILVACLVFMYSMTNVYIFAPQLKYLFWTLVAIGSNFSLVLANQEAKEAALELGDSVEPVPRAASFAEGEATI